MTDIKTNNTRSQWQDRMKAMSETLGEDVPAQTSKSEISSASAGRSRVVDMWRKKEGSKSQKSSVVTPVKTSPSQDSDMKAAKTRYNFEEKKESTPKEDKAWEAFPSGAFGSDPVTPSPEQSKSEEEINTSHWSQKDPPVIIEQEEEVNAEPEVPYVSPGSRKKVLERWNKTQQETSAKKDVAPKVETPGLPVSSLRAKWAQFGAEKEQARENLTVGSKKPWTPKSKTVQADEKKPVQTAPTGYKSLKLSSSSTSSKPEDEMYTDTWPAEESPAVSNGESLSQLTALTGQSASIASRARRNMREKRQKGNEDSLSSAPEAQYNGETVTMSTENLIPSTLDAPSEIDGPEDDEPVVNSYFGSNMTPSVVSESAAIFRKISKGETDLARETVADKFVSESKSNSEAFKNNFQAMSLEQLASDMRDEVVGLQELDFSKFASDLNHSFTKLVGVDVFGSTSSDKKRPAPSPIEETTAEGEQTNWVTF